MKTTLTLERFDKFMRLLEKREQLSKSYTLDFMRMLYVQHTNSTYGGIGASASNFKVTMPPGFSPWSIGQGQHYGIVVGEGTGTPSPLDSRLWMPIGHGKKFKGTPSQFTNPDFETGDLTGWTTSGSPDVQEGGFPGSGGKYYCRMHGEAIKSIRQDLDFTNIVTVRVSFKAYFSAVGWYYWKFFIDTTEIWKVESQSGTFNYTVDWGFDYSGVHTFKIEYRGGYSNQYMYVDNVLAIGKQLEYGGSELLEPIFSDPDGELTMRRYFTNHSGSSITVNEAGVVVYPGRMIIHDLVSPGITLADGEILRVAYTPQITV